MILQKEIRDFAKDWDVPLDTVDKDYVLGHFLAGFYQHFGEQLVFKGGTCLRKCYFPGYRFSEDLDFTSRSGDFELTHAMLEVVSESVQAHNGIMFNIEDLKPLIHQDQPKGYQAKLRYWGANHGKNQQTPPPERWLTKIKLEISTDEVLVTTPQNQPINHPYSDELIQDMPIACYTIDEVIAEKLRSLAQRSYSAPRDFYDLYQLTTDFSKEDWQRIMPVFKEKMEHKRLIYDDPAELVNEKSLDEVRRAWDNSLAHQIPDKEQADKNMMIDAVAQRILQNLA